MLFAFPLMPPFMISYDTLLLFPSPPWFIVCSKQVDEAVMSENVKLCKSETIQAFAASCPAAEQAAGCAGHCHPCAPEMQHWSAPCDSESLSLGHSSERRIPRVQ